MSSDKRNQTLNKTNEKIKSKLNQSDVDWAHGVEPENLNE
jgi:hypothetical protein